MLVWSECALAHSRRRGGRWSDPETIVPPDGRSLHDVVEAIAGKRARTFVVSPIASTTLTLSGFWELLTERGAVWVGGERPDHPAGGARGGPRRPGGPIPPPPPPPRPKVERPNARYRVQTLVLAGKPDIVRYAAGDKTITWVSGTQFFSATEESLADSFGWAWTDPAGPVPVGSAILRGLADRAGLWLRIFQRLSDWWVEHDGGPWSNTAGGLSMSYVRHRIQPKALLSHTDSTAREIEEAGLFGGRAACWFLGWVGDRPGGGETESPPPPPAPYPGEPGPLASWDISSMYPTILATRDFPARLHQIWDKPSVSTLGLMLKSWLVMAVVRVRSDTGEYPRRAGDRVEYPAGEFDTTLCGPELSRAYDDGEIVRVYRAVTYHAGRPFAAAAGELIDLRRGAAAAAGPGFEMFVKLLGTSFGGKLAQKKHSWRRRPDVPAERDWGEWPHVDAGTGVHTRFRSRAGLVEEKVLQADKGRPLGACFAWLTSHGRYAMRAARDVLPARTVVSQDTDGLWIIGSAIRMREVLAKSLAVSGFRLRSEPSQRCGRWYGPRHYWTPAGWVLAGVHCPRDWVGGDRWTDSYTVNPVFGAYDRPPVWVYECVRGSELGQLPAGGVVGEDGWVSPRRA